jgi:hypothetical protein
LAKLRWLDGEDSVTAAKKLFLAAAIVAAGYGVAFLLGGPSPSSVSQVTSYAGEKHTGSPPATVAAPEFDTWLRTSLPPSSARLVPDPQGEAASHFRLHESGTKTESPPPITDPIPHATAANTPRNEPVHFPELFASTPEAQPIPRARLLNEAPRPIADGSHSTPAAQHPPSLWAADEQIRQVAAAEVGQEAPRDVMPAQFTTAADSLNANAYAGANVTRSSTATGPPPLAPLPFTSIPATEEPRSHIVVDGDSLAKLAGRYLDDPHRAAEIYQLNRHVLTNPELLPIGVELAIPSRSAATHAATTSPQSSMQRTVATHAPAAGGLVPIRPIPRATSITPRAFLAPPRRAD